MSVGLLLQSHPGFWVSPGAQGPLQAAVLSVGWAILGGCWAVLGVCASQSSPVTTSGPVLHGHWVFCPPDPSYSLDETGFVRLSSTEQGGEAEPVTPQLRTMALGSDVTSVLLPPQGAPSKSRASVSLLEWG